jgi:TRAP-type C4-dicarboxylate transport system permease small subunit
MKTTRERLHNAVNVFDSAIVVFAMLSLIAMAAITVLGVILRYVFSMGLQWGEEITLVLVCWFTCISMGMGVKLDIHISISILPKSLPAWFFKLLGKLKAIVLLCVGIVFFYYGIKLSIITSKSILPATMLPASLMYIPLPLASLFVLHEGIVTLFDVKQDNIENMLKKVLRIKDSDEVAL